MKFLANKVIEGGFRFILGCSKYRTTRSRLNTGLLFTQILSDGARIESLVLACEAFPLLEDCRHFNMRFLV